ncbi:MAG: AAA family ATPase [Burkholderiaceae bacterium]
MDNLPLQPDPNRHPVAQYVVLLGVAGSGKTTVGKALAERLGTTFVEGDDYHPRANVEKMLRGLPLLDDERWPWIGHVAGAMRSHFARCEQARRQDRIDPPAQDTPIGLEALARLPFAVCACSPMRLAHRDYLVGQVGEPIAFIELNVPREMLRARIREREDHYQATLQLDSQIAMMEPLHEHEDGFAVDASLPVQDVVAQICERLAVS